MGWTWVDVAIFLFFALIMGFVATAHLWREVTPYDDPYLYFREKKWFPSRMALNPVGYTFGICLMVIIIASSSAGPGESFLSLLARFGSIMLFIAFYYSILALFQPLLRKRYQSTTCATLWLLPNLIYLLMAPYHTFFQIRVPRLFLFTAGVVWAAGFLFVVARGILSHLRFRKRLLADAYEANSHIRYLFWHEAKEALQSQSIFGETYPIPMISPGITTPLAVGFTGKGKRVFLPEKEYTDEELILIFRHEIVHLMRDDSFTKFYLLVCRALVWFLPTAKIVCDRAAEDMELSCDELVLTYAGSEVREQYAELILNTAATAEGFTTCLSASAEGMKYRLERILYPEKRKKGIVMIILVTALMLLSGSLVTITY